MLSNNSRNDSFLLNNNLSTPVNTDEKEKATSIAVIGAGWYGCHLATILRDQGYNVTILERNSKVFTEASRWNQFRLHQGFHYARSWSTRIETLKGFYQMIEKYPFLTTPVEKNYYAIAEQSHLDFGTVLQIMDASALKYELVEIQDTKLSSVQGVLRCDEYTFLPVAAQSYFSKKLENICRFEFNVLGINEKNDRVIVNGIQNGEAISQEYDRIIDCTYNHLQLETTHKHFFEPCILLTYKFVGAGGHPPSYTIIDGDFISLFEYQNGEDTFYTLSSVPDTPLGTYINSRDAEDRINNISEKEVQSKRLIFEKQVSVFLSNFKEEYEYTGFFTACKTKLESGSANRECVSHQTARTISVFGGKITGIFHAEQYVSAWLNEDALAPMDARSIVLNHSVKQF